MEYADETGSLLIAVLVALAHGFTHYSVGDPASFGDAGVNAAGAAVFLTALVVSYVYNKWGWKKLKEL